MRSLAASLRLVIGHAIFLTTNQDGG